MGNYVLLAGHRLLGAWACGGDGDKFRPWHSRRYGHGTRHIGVREFGSHNARRHHCLLSLGPLCGFFFFGLA